MKKSVYQLALEAGLEPFNPVNVPTGPAAELGERISTELGSRNVYFSKEYRERWGVEVHRIETSPQRLCMGAVESALPPGAPERRFRAVIFRCDGDVLYQTPDNRALDRYSAEVDLRYWIAHTDEWVVLQNLCRQAQRLAVRQHDKVEAVLAVLARQEPP